MRKAFFCYEEGPRGPSPVIYYDEIPTRISKEDRKKQLRTYNVSHLVKLPDEEVSLAECIRLYPYLTSESSTVIIKTEDKKMVKAVTGFLTRNGERFFDTQAKAEFYDASYDLRTSATDAVVALGIGNNTHVTALVEAFEKFLADESDLVLAYLTSARAVQSADKVPDGMDGSTTRDNSTDDPSVHTSTNSEMGETGNAKTKPSTIRGKSASPLKNTGE